MISNRSLVGIALAAGLAVGSVSLVARQGAPPSVKDEVALQQAIETETVRGDLKGAIEQYNKLGQSKDRAIAVKALLRMADLYQRIGTTEAQKTYERIAREFPDQTEAASLARRRLGFEIPIPLGPDPFLFSVSPDGQKIAYVSWPNPERFGGLAATVSSPDWSGERTYSDLVKKGITVKEAKELLSGRVWVRSLDTTDDKILPGTEFAKWEFAPFWSPDSHHIGFAICGPERGNPECAGSGVRLKKVALVGGPAQLIVGFPPNIGGLGRGIWNRDGVILISPDGVRKVLASGGPVSDVTSLDRVLLETNHVPSWFLPDNQHFIFRVVSDKPENVGVFVGSLTSSSKTRLPDTSSKAAYSQGFLLFARPTRPGVATLFAQPFDADRLQLTGDALPVVEDVLYYDAKGIAGFDLSSEGTLIYRTSSPEAIATLQTLRAYAYVLSGSSPVRVIRNWTLLLKR